jgi:glucosylglycerate synthase
MSDAARATMHVAVGIPTLDAAAAADAVLQEIRSSLTARGARITWRILLAEDRSANGAETPLRRETGAGDELLDVPYTLQPSDLLNEPYHGQPGRARVIHAILRDARAHGAGACIVAGRPLTASAVAWVDRCVQTLVEEDLDFIGPVYDGHPFTRGLVHGVVYPVFRALYGARLRYPIGDHFACSSRFIDAVLADPVWGSDTGQIGIDLWMSAAAVSGGFRIGQSIVLSPGSEERPGIDLATMIAQVVGFLFADMERRVLVWQRVRGSRTVAQIGPQGRPAPPPEVDVASFADSFRHGYRDLENLLTEVLPPLALLQWRRLAAAPLEVFRVDDALWARTIYDFALGHRLRVIARDHLLRSLTPLYLAWLASFVLETRLAPVEAAEVRLERLCLAFEAEKPYLVSQWRWPERFRPVKLRR